MFGCGRSLERASLEPISLKYEQGNEKAIRERSKLPTLDDFAENAFGIPFAYDEVTKTWMSPAGLKYAPNEVGGNYMTHALEHAAPDSTKRTHSVFSDPAHEILKLVDEAWQAKIGEGFFKLIDE